jgi:tripartite-type tricarboxylate transporter receptor subunit TctC
LRRGRAAKAQTEPSFAGKQIKLLIGFSPTGYGYDTYGRLLARHLGKYLPGNPAILPQNRPGAGSLNLANYIYNAAPRDGSEIAIVGRGVAMGTHRAQSQGKPIAANCWLGSMNNVGFSFDKARRRKLE